MVSVFRQQVKVFVDANLTPEAQSARLIEVAEAARDDAITSGRASTRYTTFVDGSQAASEVGARKVIAYRYEYLADAVTFALGFLKARSPVLTGYYQSSFAVSVEGTLIAASDITADQIGTASEVMIWNTRPYSRKVDIQLVGNRVLHFSVPPNLFGDAARAVQSRFGNTVTAKRITDLRFAGQWVGKRGKNKGRLTDSPAVLITPLR